MPTATATRGAATRAAILDRGVDLASAEGLEALSIGRLASELGMSKSGLFAHFGSKHELQLAIVDAAASRFREAVIDPVKDTPDGARRLRAMTAAYIADLDSGGCSGGCFWAATSAEYDDRPGPVRLAFELYALVMGANARFRLSGDRRVFTYARDSAEELLAELPR
jgi:AcrR family transcriptional regulator